MVAIEPTDGVASAARLPLVATGTGGIVEVQGTAEGAPFSEETLLRMLRLSRIGTDEIFALQRRVLGI